MAFLYMSVLPNFEELRVQDYLHAYSTTGRPPQPCPPQPTDPQARITAGLPPLFNPLSEADFLAIKDPESLPPAHEFSPTLSEQDFATLQSISAMPSFQFFSHEELRIYAYIAGNVLSPTPIAMSPFVQSSNSTTTTSASPASGPAGAEQLLAITTQPAYAGHSFEELRVTYMQAGREVSSAEIIASQSPRPPASGSGSGSGVGSGSSSAPAAPQPLFARPAPTRLF